MNDMAQSDPPRCPACARDLWSVPLARYCPDCGAALAPASANIEPARAAALAPAMLFIELAIALVALFGIVSAVRDFAVTFQAGAGRINFITFGVPTEFDSLFGWLRLAAAGAWVIGWWRVAGLARSHAPRAAALLQTSAAGLVLAVALTGLYEATTGGYSITPFSVALNGFNIAAYLGLFAFAMVLSRRLAFDAADPRLARFALVLLWLLPLLATVGAILIIGPLVAAGLCIAFLELLRQRMNAVAVTREVRP
jgi:hypothetical protein